MIEFPLIQLRPNPETLYVSQDRTVFASGRNGFIDEGSTHGLFVYETRLLSEYVYRVDGNTLPPVALSNIEQHSWLGYYIMTPPGISLPQPDDGSGQVQLSAENTLEIRISRTVGEGAHEDIDITNYSMQSTKFQLELAVNGDFASLSEVGRERQQKGDLQKTWRQFENGACELHFDYQAAHHWKHQGRSGNESIHRQLKLLFRNFDSQPEYDRGIVRFQIALNPQETWHTCVFMNPIIDGKLMAPEYGCRSLTGIHTDMDRLRNFFLQDSTQFRTVESGTLAPGVIRTLEQAQRDLASLRLHDLNWGEQAWTMAAGLPIYIALFGRDTLTTAWQAALLSTEMLAGTLYELAQWQGKEVNDWRDEQPGRMLHEAHTGPLEMLNYNPRRGYYGSITTSGFYPVVVSELWHWTGEKGMVQPLIKPMLAALRWLDEWSDLDGDGFYEYQTRSTQGTKHQAWKDSRDAIVDADGNQVEPPIATSEEQAFAYIAKLHGAEVLWWMGEKDEAKRLYHQAEELKKRFNEAFWMPDEGFFAMGLDSQNRQIRSIGSNAGHLLGTAIVDSALVEKTADRLLEKDMFSGWGIRTLSDQNPAYNPYSYHRGSIWPVEHGTFAVGFMRYGLWDHLERLTRAQFEAAALFSHFRLPEVFSGHARDRDHPFPAFYPQTNSPQAWSASAVFLMLQSLLGLYPYAPLNTLVVDPHLPAWLPEITLKKLKVGKAMVDIQFLRNRDGSSDYKVLDQRGKLRIIRQPSPWSLSAGVGERLVDFLSSYLPGK
jgi:glycogen debranching enzyme